MANVSKSLVFSPVSYKKKRAFSVSMLYRDPLVFYKRKYYMLSDYEELLVFYKNPELFDH